MISSQEKPDDALRPGRLWTLGITLFLLGFLPLGLGLGGIQLWHDNEYRKRARTQSQRLILLPAPRGNILDRHGRLIVGNRPCCNIVADLSGMQDEIRAEREQLVRRHLIIKRLTDPDAALGKKQSGEISGIAIRNVLQRYLDKTNRLFGRNDVVDVKAVTYHAGQRLRRALPFTLVSDISENELAKFVENFPPNAPVRISFESVRTYPHGTMAAHILGYLRQDRSPASTEKLPDTDEAGNSSAEMLAEFLEQPDGARRAGTLKKYNGLRPAATGLEYRFDKDILQGTPGYEFWTVRPNYYLYEKISEAAPRQGNHLVTALDLDLQLAAEKSLARRVPGHDAAVVVLDVKTGEVLAMASAPTFDPALAGNSEYYEEITESGKNVWVNRAAAGLYAPGSTFKPITAIAAMRTGVVTPYETIDCGQFIELGNRKYREHDGRAYGDVDIPRMLEISCNVYCYKVALLIGQHAGIRALTDEINRFGLDAKSEIEIGSIAGIAASPEYKRKTGRGGWSLGDSVQTAIGQGFTLTTPLNLACFYASLARNETHTIPTLLRKPENDKKRVNHGGEPIGLSQEQYTALQSGLRRCAENGTGRMVAGTYDGGALFNHDPSLRPAPLHDLNIAVKTGTAQKELPNGKMSHIAWIGAFAPAYDPRVAICVMVDEGDDADRELAGGKTAGPIANDVLAEWKRIYFRDTPLPDF